MNVAKRQKRLLRRVGVGRLGIVDEQHAPQAPDLLHPMREAGESLERAGDLLALDAEGPCGGISERRVLTVVRAAQRSRSGEIDGRRILRAGPHATLAYANVGK